MPIIDFSGGSNYRDAMRGMTLKALQDRQTALANQSVQAAQPQQIRSPLQGIAGIGDVIGANIREARGAAAIQSGRQRMAELLAGGLQNPQDMAEAMTIDPETTMKYQEQQWANQNQQQLFQHQDTEQQQGFKHADAEQQATIQANKDAADAQVRASQAADAVRYGHEDKSAATLAQTNAATAAKAAETAAGVATTQYTREIAEKQEGPVPPEVATKYGGDVAQNPGRYKYNPTTGDVTPITPQMMGPGALKPLYDQQDKYVQTASTVNQLQTAKDLLRQGINWGRLEGPMKTQLGASGVGSKEDQDQAQRTIRYNSIMGGQALLSLAETLKGASSDKDVAVFMTIMNNDAMSPEEKSKAIDDMIAKVNSNLELQRTRIQQLGGEMPKAPVPPAADEKAIAFQKARDALKRNVDPELVKKRLVDNGYDPAEL
jgi:hypothetical protein